MNVVISGRVSDGVGGGGGGGGGGIEGDRGVDNGDWESYWDCPEGLVALVFIVQNI